MNRMRFLTCLWILSGYPLLAWPQNLTGPDTTLAYIEKLDTMIVVKFSFNNEFERFEQTSGDQTYDIRPNVSLVNRISGSYRFISGSISFLLPFLPGNNDEELKGSTSLFSIGFDLSAGKWTQSLHGGYAKGFYLKNTGAFIDDWQEGTDPYLQLPDLKTYFIRGSTLFKVNDNFSLKSITSQTEIQLKSCGSWLPNIDYSYYIIDNKTESGSTSSQRSDNLHILLNPGYGHTWVLHRHWYFSAAGFAGLGFHQTWLLTRYPDEQIHSENSDWTYSGSVKTGIGYTSERFIAGATFNYSRILEQEKNSDVHLTTTRQYLHIFIGFRLGAPGFLRNATDYATDVIPALR